MSDIKIIGLDLGGTNINAVLVDVSGKVRSKLCLNTEAVEGPDRVIERMSLAARNLCDQLKCSLDDVAGIGIGAPGPLRLREGIVVDAANLPGWNNVHIRDRIQELTGRPTILVNDANAAAYGEYWVGLDQRVQNLCLLTLGTGVGGGVICNGEIVEGCFDNAGEIGHTIIFPGGRTCRCGQRGCLEVYAGASYIVEQAVQRMVNGEGDQLRDAFTAGSEIDVPAIVAAARQGDVMAQGVWAEVCLALALACVNLQHTFNPERILLGGGVAAAGDALLDPLREKFGELTWNLTDDQPRIEFAAMGATAGAIGAAGWYYKSIQRQDSASPKACL